MFKSNLLHSRVQLLLENLLTATIYFILARLSLLLQFHSSNATPVWPPSGFAFAMMLIAGYRVSPGIMLGAFSANVSIFLSNQTSTLPESLLLSFCIAVGNTGEALTGYYLLQKLVKKTIGRNFFSSVTRIFLFGFVAAAMCLVSAAIGSTTNFLAGIVPQGEYFIVWLTWWLGDISGILLVTPFIIIWYYSPSLFVNAGWKRTLEIFLFFLFVIVTSGMVFDNWFFDFFIFQWAFWMIPVLTWSALRFSQLETIAGLVICSIIAIWGTVNGYGPFGNQELNQALLTVQAFISIITITQLALNASVVERKRTEEALKETRNQLEKKVQDRTAALEQKNQQLERINYELASFSYIASHDLQEPLRKIQMFSKRIVETESHVLSEAGKNYFQRMQNAAERMQRLIEDLLAYSRTNTSDEYFEKTDLNILLENVQADMKEKILESGATIKVMQLPALKVIPFQFQQLFTNLVSNSLKFAKPGTAPYVVIDSSILDGEKINAANINPGKKYCCISFRDNGIGFDPGHNKQIFELFQRLHSRIEYDGTGIGLAICKKIVENHGGFITADGNPGEGAVFHICLPVDN